MFIHLFWQQMIKGFCSIITLILLFPSVLFAENAKFNPPSGILSIPIVEVPNGNGVDCFQADLSLVPSSDPLSFILNSVVQVNCEELTSNEQLTRELIGVWTFTYTIDNSTITKVFTLPDNVEESSSTLGEFNVFGSDQNDTLSVIAGYTPDLEEFLLLDVEEGPIDNFFTFNFTSENAVSGCHFLFNNDTSEFSDCHDFIGTRTSATAKSAPRGKSIIEYEDAYQHYLHLRDLINSKREPH